MKLIDYHNSNDYIQALRSSCISNFHIKDCFNDVPEYLYKFKSFGKWNKSQWQEDLYWKDSVRGELYFSNPAKFNKNDPNDCKFYCNELTVMKYLDNKLNGAITQGTQGLSNLIEQFISQYVKNLQYTSRVCCFTEKDENNKFMWNNCDFTSNGYGFCIKYRFNSNDDIFLQGTINCFPVAYTNENMDFTNEVCLFMDLVQKYGKHFPADDPNVREFAFKANAHTLIKNEQYQEEREWRIVVPSNRYEQYLTIKDENSDHCKRNFLPAIDAIYINSKCREIPDWNGHYLDFIKVFIKDTCSSQNIDLFYYDDTINSSYKIQ